MKVSMEIPDVHLASCAGGAEETEYFNVLPFCRFNSSKDISEHRTNAYVLDLYRRIAVHICNNLTAQRNKVARSCNKVHLKIRILAQFLITAKQRWNIFVCRILRLHFTKFLQSTRNLIRGKAGLRKPILNLQLYFRRRVVMLQANFVILNGCLVVIVVGLNHSRRQT